MDLSRLRPAPGAVRKPKRVGRGPGSGLGKTAGRGHKGRKSRSGGNTPPAYEGGQNPIHRRLPKRGFHSPNRVEYNLVHVGQLVRFAAGSVVGPDELRSARLVRRTGPIKCLADGELAHALTLKVHAVSAKARERIAAAGGTVEVVE